MSFLREVEKRLDLPRGEKARVLAELESHWVEARDELIASGMDATSAEQQAGMRLGTADDVAARLSAVHNSATWKSSLLAAIPFVAAPLLALFTPTNAPPILYGLILRLSFLGLMLAGSVRELVSGRRPIWLASWLAAGLLAVPGVVWHFVGHSITLGGAIKPDSASLTALRQINMISVAVIALVMTAALWGSSKWRIPALILGLWSILAASVSLDHASAASALAVWCGSLAAVALSVLFAWRVFASHRHGSAAQASLFLLTFMTTGYGPGFGGSPLFMFMVIMACTSAIAVVCFARVGNSSRKVLVILASLLIAMAGRTANQLQYYPQEPVTRAIAMFAAMLPAYLVTASLILTPFLIEYLRQRRDRLTLAR